ncbi:MAG: arsenate reductase ArsC [Pseudomonadota bacterium]
MNILILCTGNSARSILLEKLMNHLGGGRITAYSAGSQPTGRVNPHAIELLTQKGYQTADLRSKSWDEFEGADAVKMEVVITVCGSAAEETCPIWPGAPIRAHWGAEDPAAAPPEKAAAAFNEAYDILARRAAAFVKEPFDTMPPAALRGHLSDCGKLS